MDPARFDALTRLLATGTSRRQLLTRLGGLLGIPPLRGRSATPAASPAVVDQVAAAWVELGPTGTQLARAITYAATCPGLSVDGVVQAMTPRATPDPAFPVTVCERTIPPGAQAAAVEGRAVRLLTAPPQRIAVIGDTGCLMQDPSYFQACNDPHQWPFAQIAAQVAAWQPDLIIHVGDYLLREDVCPSGNRGCAGNPAGDTWAAWHADFFAPASTLLATAPWLVLRGNHETCGRGGNGWFRLLDPRTRPAACQDYTAPYAVPIGSTTLVVLDSAAASDSNATGQVDEYRRQLGLLGQLAGADGWLLSHRPIWGPIELNGGATLATGNATLQAASGNVLPAGIKLVIAGHVHLAEVLSFDPAAQRPPVLIAGNGGVTLDPAIQRSLPGITLAGAKLVTGVTLHEFGYLTLDASGAGWTATERGVTGTPLTTCVLRELTVTCAA